MLKELYYEVKSKIISFVADIRIYKYPMFIILFGDTSYKVKEERKEEIIKLLQPGDILLRTYHHFVGSLFISGYWTHAALYEGDNNIIHMLGKGITREGIQKFLIQKFHYRLLE